jgi:hypothetical protein
MTAFLHRLLPNLTPPPDCRGCAVEQRRTTAYVQAKLAGKPGAGGSAAPFPLAREAADRPVAPSPRDDITHSLKLHQAAGR